MSVKVGWDLAEEGWGGRWIGVAGCEIEIWPEWWVEVTPHACVFILVGQTYVVNGVVYCNTFCVCVCSPKGSSIKWRTRLVGRKRKATWRGAGMLLVIVYCIAVQLCFVVLFVVRPDELNGGISMMGAWAGSLGGGRSAEVLGVCFGRLCNTLCLCL